MIKIPHKAPITITNKAVEKIQALTSKNNKSALKIGVKKGGCAGMEYTMDLVDEIGKTEEVIEVDGARVIIAATAQMFLFGSEIDYEVGILESGFKFNNPNVEEACGCGESIKFKEQT